jgi:uracil-DNA glycosylase
MIEEKLEKYLFLKDSLPDCLRCCLHRERIKTVWGEGNDLSAEVVFLGEAPGKEENISGQPFVGKSGVYLRSIMNQSRIDWNKIFITNTIKCRPPGNRNPTREEEVACAHWLMSQLLFIKPRAIVCVGKCAVSWITGKPMEELCGSDYLRKPFEWHNKLIVGIYHPSYALRGHREEFVTEFSFAMGILKERGINIFLP